MFDVEQTKEDQAIHFITCSSHSESSALHDFSVMCPYPTNTMFSYLITMPGSSKMDSFAMVFSGYQIDQSIRLTYV